jgi:hypothetical protein
LVKDASNRVFAAVPLNIWKKKLLSRLLSLCVCVYSCEFVFVCDSVIHQPRLILYLGKRHPADMKGNLTPNARTSLYTRNWILRKGFFLKKKKKKTTLASIWLTHCCSELLTCNI